MSVRKQFELLESVVIQEMPDAFSGFRENDRVDRPTSPSCRRRSSHELRRRVDATMGVSPGPERERTNWFPPCVGVTRKPVNSSVCPLCAKKSIQRLLHAPRAGTATHAWRTSSNAICCVVEGEGETRVGNDRISWRQRDIFTLPQGNWISHSNDQDSATFRCF